MTPKFCKRYVEIGPLVAEALERFCVEVEQQSFPGPAHTPYAMPIEELQTFHRRLKRSGHSLGAEFWQAESSTEEDLGS